MKTISLEILEKAGYREFEKGEFQKRVDDEKGIKYFINIKRSVFNLPEQHLTFWDFEMQINTPKGAVNIELVQWFNNDGEGSGNSVKDAEDYLERMWEFNDRPYYEEF